jgi:hypothetical protein
VIVSAGEVPGGEARRQPFAAARCAAQASMLAGESARAPKMPARQPVAYSARGGPPVISGLVPAGGDVGGAEAEREFHQPGPVVHAGFEVGGRGGNAERGQPVVQAGDGAQADG